MYGWIVAVIVVGSIFAYASLGAITGRVTYLNCRKSDIDGRVANNNLGACDNPVAAFDLYERDGLEMVSVFAGAFWPLIVTGTIMWLFVSRVAMGPFTGKFGISSDWEKTHGQGIKIAALEKANDELKRELDML